MRQARSAGECVQTRDTRACNNRINRTTLTLVLIINHSLLQSTYDKHIRTGKFCRRQADVSIYRGDADDLSRHDGCRTHADLWRNRLCH